MIFSSLDLLMLESVSVSFVVFIILKIIIFRLLHPEAVLRGIMIVFLITTVIQGIGLALLYKVQGWVYPGGLLFLLAISFFFFGLLAFVYIVCVFGPSETSIRIRLVRELSESKGGRLTHVELLSRYNGRMILERRLQRLKLSGEINEDNGKYILKGKANAFFLIDVIAGWIQKMVQPKS